jgi:probable rRNA maturation factor
MEIQINSQREIPGLKIQKIKRKLEKVLKDLACHDKELSILFTDDKQIAELNKRYLQRKGPTNVLAFPMAGGPVPQVESVMLGDVAISIDTALRDSEELGEPLEYTIDRLLIHGVLHLLGYDHEKSSGQAKRMALEEERLMAVMMEA